MDASINQRDLRMRSREIMDAVERGESFAVTRDGRVIANLEPVVSRQVSVPARQVIEAFRHVPVIDGDAMREQLDAIIDPSWGDPYAR